MGRRILILAVLAILVIAEYGLLFYLLRAGSGEAPPPGEGASPSASIVHPPDGYVVILGETVDVTVEVTTSARLVSARLFEDGKPKLRLPSVILGYPDRQVAGFRWEASLTGTHRLEALLLDTDGRQYTATLSVEVIRPLYLCFASNRDGDYELYRMKADGTDLEQLTFNSVQDREPTQAPDGTIAFASSADGVTWGIYLLRGGEIAPLPGKGSRREPVFDPTGRYLAFVAAGEKGVELSLLDLKAGSTQPLVLGTAYAGQVSWAPSGAEFAFTALRDGNWDVFRLRREGGEPIRLTRHPAQDWHPAWHPDGKEIAFVSSREGPHRLYLMSTDGSEMRRVEGVPDGVEQPAFSPDGKLLAFVAYTGEGRGLDARELYVMPLATGRPIRLTRNSYDDTDVTWCYGE